MTTKTQGKKIWTLQCGGGDRGGCGHTIETDRRGLREAVASMAAHASDSNHRFNNFKPSRSWRWVEE